MTDVRFTQPSTESTSSLIQKNIPLADKNWFGTGGPARYFAQPHNAQEFQQAVMFAYHHNLPLFILGSGANIVISDTGFDGIVIRPQLQQCTIKMCDDDAHAFVTAGAGTDLNELIEFCLDNNLIGLEEFSGIPGTIGGAVYINLHYFEFLLEQFLISAEVIHKKTGQLQHVDVSWFGFGYNESQLLKEEHYLVNATFKLKKVDEATIAFARGRKQEIIRHRTARYPAARTCGSFFRNFHPHEVTWASETKPLIWVAYYLDKIGIKGVLEHGDAMVSHKHANMIINRGNATSHDIIMVARQMQALVKEKFGILPQPECRLIGFKEYPLLCS